MRHRAEWMKPPDDEILEHIEELGNMTPLALSNEGQVARIDITRKYAGIRCRELLGYGLLERVDRGLYGITDDGRKYLEGELDASELTKNEP